jgi:hypothetical protein
MNIQDYYGRVTKCACTNPDLPESCNKGCFCRGYIAECLACMGTGMVVENVAGSSGKMQVTCAPCSGKGKFPINKPKDWDILNPPPVPVETSSDATSSMPPVPSESIEVHGDGTTVNPADPTWKTPPAKVMHLHNTPMGEPVTSII